MTIFSGPRKRFMALYSVALASFSDLASNIGQTHHTTHGASRVSLCLLLPTANAF